MASIQNDSLRLIDRICDAYENTSNEDTNLATEILRVIRAIAANRKVTLLSDGMAAKLLQNHFAQDKVLWSFILLEDDSVPES